MIGSESSSALDELAALVRRFATPAMTTAVDGLLLSRADHPSEPEHALAQPQLVVVVAGGKRLHLGADSFSYRSGQYLLVSTELPVIGEFVDASPAAPALGIAVGLRPEAIAPLVVQAPPARSVRGDTSTLGRAVATGEAGPDLLDAVLRLVRLLEHPRDIEVLAPLYEQEILWRLLTGPHGATLRDIGLGEGTFADLDRAISWIRRHHAEPLRIGQLAEIAAMSPSTFHRHFRAVTAMSPLEFQKRIRLQRARSLLVSRPDDVAGVGHDVGYGSPSQFSREYRRLFGDSPTRDAAALRAAVGALPAGS